jgi:hypothetical protein
MRRICLTVVGSFLLFLNSFSQSAADSTSEYHSPDLKLEEANLVTNYYSQTGNHSAITGGVGTQHVTDVSNIIELKYIRWGEMDRKITMDFDLGIDHHTAASSAYVSKSGASKTGGTRVYPSANWQIENNEKRTTFGLGAALSFEYTYHSYSLNAIYSKHSIDKNTEFSAKANVFMDAVKLVYPSELRPVTSAVTSASGGGSSSPTIPSKLRSTFATSFTLSHVINKNMQVALIGDVVAQGGYLGLPFHRIYFSDKSVGVERLPDSRFKLPLGVRFNYFAGDKVIFRTYYRYYVDSWGISAHTASIEAAVKITPFLSVSPFYRYYTQTTSDYFAPKYGRPVQVAYFTSNYDYSAFNSDYEGINLRFVPLNGVFGIKNLSMIELRYGHYGQTTGLVANNISLNLRFK